MKSRLITLIVFYTLFCSLLRAQSASSAIDSLVKYGVITKQDRPALEKELKSLKNNDIGSYRVAVLSGLGTIIFQKTYHIDLHKGSIHIDYGDQYLSKKRRDSIKTPLRQFLEKLK